MPDRELTKEELMKFIAESKTGKIFKALEVFAEEKTKPSLHDLCISELSACIDGLKTIVIEQGREINRLRRIIERWKM